MTFLELARVRRSIRAFTPQAVEAEKVEAILEAANLAPSAGNLQAYEIFTTTSEADRRALAQASHQGFLTQAPVALVFCAAPYRNSEQYGQRGTRLYALQDATIACTYAMLAAAELGLSTVWVGAFEEIGVRRAIHAGPDVTPVAILPIGYPAEHPPFPGRRHLDDLVHRRC